MKRLLVTLFALLVVMRSGGADESGSRVADQELGLRMGGQMNFGGLGPGGFYVAGTWLYRLTDVLYFDGRAGFAIGSGDPVCSFSARSGPSCDLAVASGVGVEILAGLRYFWSPDARFTPWVGGGIGGKVASFSGDDLTGIGIPFWAGIGLRQRIGDTVSVGLELDASVAPMHYGKDVDWKGDFAVNVLVGVEFAL